MFTLQSAAIKSVVIVVGLYVADTLLLFFNDTNSFLSRSLVLNNYDLNIANSVLVDLVVVVVIIVDVDVDVLLFNIMCQILALARSSLSSLPIKFLSSFFVFISSDLNTAILFALILFFFCSFL